MDLDLIRSYSEGLICLSGCPGSRFVQYLKAGNREEAIKLLHKMGMTLEDISNTLDISIESIIKMI